MHREQWLKGTTTQLFGLYYLCNIFGRKSTQAFFGVRSNSVIGDLWVSLL